MDMARAGLLTLAGAVAALVPWEVLSSLIGMRRGWVSSVEGPEVAVEEEEVEEKEEEEEAALLLPASPISYTAEELAIKQSDVPRWVVVEE
eukprot:evm.model.NODE_32014_length_7592_cov_19.431902.1